MTRQSNPLTRCTWVKPDDSLCVAYHDREWGVPVDDDRTLFEFLILEGAQAGLSWSTILHKRAGYRDAFAQFDVATIAAFDPMTIEALCHNPAIVRHRLKIKAAVTNARAFSEIQNEWGSFSAWLWRFVDGTPLQNAWTRHADVPARTPLSDSLSQALKKRGFKFTGSTICYSLMQAVGLVNDHVVDCFRYREVADHRPAN